MEDLTGKQLGPYRIEGPLGEGGMAAVYKAYQASMGRHVALKILPRHFANDPSFVARFDQEARIIARLQHVHIVPVYDYGHAEGYTYLVMPFIPTGTLADVMRAGHLTPGRVRTVILQVGEALGYAHAQGVIHRDVKPSNILVDERGNCRLTDFGIAKMVEGTLHLTQTGAMTGTPSYMSPEQIQGETLDGRSDLYSLGVILFEMATGRPPFLGETPAAVLVKHLHDRPPNPRSIRRDLAPDLEKVILKALAKAREQRYPDIASFVQAVKAAILETPATAPGPMHAAPLEATGASAVPGRMRKQMKASPGRPTRSPVPTLLGIIALLLFLLLGEMALAAYLFWIRPAQQPQVPGGERVTPETASTLINDFDGSPLATYSLNGVILANPESVRQAALASLESPEFRVRFAAVYALSLTAESSHRESLRAVMEREEDLGLRILAARALIALGEKESIPVLITALPSDDPLPYWNPPELQWVPAYSDLNRYTGQDFGFLAAVESGDAAGRAAAIEVWQDWWTDVAADLEWDSSTERYTP